MLINESLLEGAVDALKRIGQVKDENITIVRAPGAYELPLVARRLAESKKFDAIVALGTVIRGGTAHFCCKCATEQRDFQIGEIPHALPRGTVGIQQLGQSAERAEALAV